MKRFQITFLLVGTAASMAPAATPVASLTSSTAFDLHGNRVNVNGVPWWPVMAGDDISTRSGQAVIQLRDGSRVELLGDSHARVESKDGRLLIRLLSGTMLIAMLGQPGSKTEFYSQNTLVKSVVGGVVSTSSLALILGAPSGAMKVTLPSPVGRR